ncbi:sodium:proton antiporter NhaD [Sulfurimonas autotrophica]|uniref:Sodium/proton antiporter, NhaD family n=1 Tax=Sulfurimonas autotrophica (strain ATCC BAA-671 / DSM 16294 / JCM 11897 / OK10) TaxID=563040 RepID=E0UQ88_SULAO|nr:sodium:proton antiporter NhaD [Sulfurimonas autotrophica]ADN09831.1 sodium/proton antiporter, NhaD family [Sulfurimonas autotrophica DSM 16294]
MEHEAINLATTWVGWASLAVFVIAYYFIATEEKYEINKSKPALFAGTFMFMLIGIYYAINGLNPEAVHDELEHLILEISEIFFFLLVAMTFIETLLERGVFDLMKYKLVSKGYTYKKLFWLTGFLAFFISPVADNLTTALILSTVLFTIDKKNLAFLVPGAINIVVAANAGGAWSPFGDITTLMSWTAGKGEFVDFLFLFPASVVGWVVTAFLLSLSVPAGEPPFDGATEKKPIVLDGGMAVVYLGILTIVIAVLGHTFFHFPAMWGMMFGLAILKLYSFQLKRSGKNSFNIYVNMEKVENDTLLFFFGILSAVGALHFLGFLEYIHHLYDLVGPTASNVGVGFLSAIVDNVPVMSAILKASPQMDIAQWMLVTMTAGIGGSLISFGSAAGVGVMGKLRGIYTFGAHMKHSWTILVGYIISIIIWYVQFEIMGLY